MRAKRRISRETLLRQLGDIPEIYILEAADALAVSAPASDSRTGAENPARRGRDLWWRIRTSPAFAICIGFIVSSVSVNVSGALEGLGKGVDSLIISALRYIVLMLPLAFVLSRVFGAAGVFHAFWVTEVLTAVISLMLWKKQKIWSK